MSTQILYHAFRVIAYRHVSFRNDAGETAGSSGRSSGLGRSCGVRAASRTGSTASGLLDARPENAAGRAHAGVPLPEIFSSLGP